MNTYFDSRIRNLVIGVLVVLIIFLVAQSIATLAGIDENNNQYPTNTINVRGVGEVLATPDIATFSFTARENAKDAATAQQALTEKANKAITYLKEQGIEEKDIKTESYNSNPTYEYRGGTCSPNGICTPSKQTLTGFEVSETVSVKVRDVSKAGDLLTGISGLQIGEVSALSFTIDDEESLRIEAKKRAIEKAKAEAKQIADSLGVRLKDVVGFYEEYPSGQPYNEYGMGGDISISAVKSQAAPVIQTGESKITAVISITYEISD